MSYKCTTQCHDPVGGTAFAIAARKLSGLSVQLLPTKDLLHTYMCNRGAHLKANVSNDTLASKRLQRRTRSRSGKHTRSRSTMDGRGQCRLLTALLVCAADVGGGGSMELVPGAITTAPALAALPRRRELARSDAGALTESLRGSRGGGVTRLPRLRRRANRAPRETRRSQQRSRRPRSVQIYLRGCCSAAQVGPPKKLNFAVSF